MGNYVWTEKAEERAKELGLEQRKEGDKAYCGYTLVSGLTAKSWLNKGYIREA